MNPSGLTLDVKSFLIGLLTAALVFVLASGRPGRAQNAGVQYSISAADDGVYILNGGTVSFMERGRCRPVCQF